MMLNERKIEILKAIVNDYIQTAEPIGSRTIAKKYALGVSSATIRNEMSDLEEMGLIVQPHASSGRVPSDKGYRLYVDRLMNFRELDNDQRVLLGRLINANINQIDYLMQETAKAISLLTKYTAVVTEPRTSEPVLKHVQFVPLDDTSILMVLVLDNKVVKNQQVRLRKSPSYEDLIALSIDFNNIIKRHSLLDISVDEYAALTAKFDGAGQVVAPVFEAINESLRVENDFQVYTSGVRNILAFPEFSDLDKANDVFQALEEREILINLLDDSGNGDGMRIVIGGENTLEQMKNCSVIKKNYQLDGRITGSIGIIGPTRMDYAQVVAVLNDAIKNMNLALKAFTGG